jgi:glycosyltransferase involved in cell wall biosynthesis
MVKGKADINLKKQHDVLFLTSHPMSVVAFLWAHVKALYPYVGVRVFANTNESDLLQKLGLEVPVEFAPVERHINLLSDLQALWWLFRKFRVERPFAVHTITPKAGLLGMTAAWFARVPVRVHSFTGQVWVTRTGLMRWLLKAADQCIAFMATNTLVDSHSQRDFLIQQGVLTDARSSVMGAGSICGVNIQRFCPSPDARQMIRRELGTSPDALVCLYLGRLNRDKGVLDLAAAFASIAVKEPTAELWVVGPDEANWFEQMQVLLGDAIGHVKRVGFTSQPERFMQAADLFCLPSYREGFGSSVIEAAACGVPALASRIYGLTDAVAEGQTGWMHEAGNVQDLSRQLGLLLSDPDELVAKGLAARKYAAAVFSEEKITGAMVDFYIKCLNEKTA